MRSDIICTPRQIIMEQAIENELWARIVALERGERSVYRFFVVNPVEQVLGIRIDIYERIILKWIFKLYGATDWIDRDKCRNLVNGVIKFPIPYNVGIS
jgi:hypothetical protein